MIPHPNAIFADAERRRKELLSTAAHERQVAPTAGAVLPWKDLAVGLITLVALALGFGV
jgi:hypothetical protein